MLKKISLFFFLSTPPCFISAQSFTINGLIENDEQIPIEFASILNISSQDFTYTNSNGEFQLLCSEGDTIEIRHISYHDKRVIANNDSINITLETKVQVLDEIVVSGKPQEEIILKKKLKQKAQYGLAMNSDYLFEVDNNSRNKIKLEGLIIPIQNRKEYSNEGSLLIAINRSRERVISSTDIMNLKALDFVDKDEILIDVANNDLYLDPRENFYIYIKRVISDQSFNNKGKNLSVNPFIFFSEKSDDNQNSSHLRVLGQNDWIDISTWLGYIPTFDIRIRAQVIE